MLSGLANKQRKKLSILKEEKETIEDAASGITATGDYPKEVTTEGMPGMLAEPSTSSFALPPSQCDNSLIQVLTSLIQQMAVQNLWQAKNAETLKMEADLRLQAEERAREEVREREKRKEAKSNHLRCLEMGEDFGFYLEHFESTLINAGIEQLKWAELLPAQLTGHAKDVLLLVYLVMLEKTIARLRKSC